MNRQAWLCFFIGLLCLTGNAGAKVVNLDKGETYRQDDLTVTCGSSSAELPLTLNACQYWDDFNNRCLFEKTTFSYKNLECVEECQHWDSFNSTCHYRTKCTFSPPNNSFVRTSCEKFDDLNKVCVQTREMKIGGRR